MTQEQLSTLREQRAQLAQQLKDLDAEIKTTEADVYKTLVLAEDSAFVELADYYKANGFKTTVTMDSDMYITCKMETFESPTKTFNYTYPRPVTTPNQCKRMCNILMDYLPCLIQLVMWCIPHGTYTFEHEPGRLSGTSCVEGFHIQTTVKILASSGSGSRKRPAYIESIHFSHYLTDEKSKGYFYKTVDVDGMYKLAVHVTTPEKQTALQSRIRIDRDIMTKSRWEPLKLTKTAFQKELEQFISKIRTMK